MGIEDSGPAVPAPLSERQEDVIDASRYIIIMRKTFVVMAFAPAGFSAAKGAELVPVGLQKQLLVDDCVIAEKQNGPYDVTELRKLAARDGWVKYAGNPGCDVRVAVFEGNPGELARTGPRAREIMHARTACGADNGNLGPGLLRPAAAR